jgi:hypothetical protein
VGRFRPGHPRDPGAIPGRPRPHQGRRRQRHRPLHAAGGCQGRAADERRPLRRRYPRHRPDRRTERGHRRRPHPRHLRQCADLAIGRAKDPLAETGTPRAFRPHRPRPDLDQLPDVEADRRIRHRPLHRRQLQPALRRGQAGLDRRSGRHPAAGTAAPADVVHRHRRPRHRRRRPQKPAWPKAPPSPAAPSTPRPRRSASASSTPAR